MKSRLTFISAFSLMVTVTLMKTAVAKNLSQSIIICVEHQNFSKGIRQSCQYPILGDARASSGFHYVTPLVIPNRNLQTFKGPLLDSQAQGTRLFTSVVSTEKKGFPKET